MSNDALEGNVRPYVLVRKSGSYDAHGRWQDGDDVRLSIMANIQNAPGRDMLLLPESLRDKGAIVVQTETEMRSYNSDDGTPSDFVEFEGRLYRIVMIRHPQNIEGLVHYRAIAVLANPGEH